MEKGYLYILSNSCMPGILKIGRSIHGGKKRAKDLYQTGVPVEFDLRFEILVSNHAKFEETIHELLDEYRVNQEREFFDMDFHHAVRVIMGEILNSIGCSLTPIVYENVANATENEAQNDV